MTVPGGLRGRRLPLGDGAFLGRVAAPPGLREEEDCAGEFGWSYCVFKVKTAQDLLINHLRGSAAPVLHPHSRARQTEGKTRRMFSVSAWLLGI